MDNISYFHLSKYRFERNELTDVQKTSFLALWYYKNSIPNIDTIRVENKTAQETVGTERGL